MKFKDSPAGFTDNWTEETRQQSVHLRILNGTQTSGLAREFSIDYYLNIGEVGNCIKRSLTDRYYPPAYDKDRKKSSACRHPRVLVRPDEIGISSGEQRLIAHRRRSGKYGYELAGTRKEWGVPTRR